VLSQYKIKGSEDDWKAALSGNKSKGVISVKGKEDADKKRKMDIPESDPNAKSFKKKKSKPKVPRN